MSHAIYNEIDPFAADWLERLVERGHIAPGRVERRSIGELTVADVAGPGQRHFFAGIGVWSYALRLAGVADDASVWTGSCPCQPFSSAGKGLGTRDPRHLWPAWFALIEKCRPAVILGEQVASRDGLAWLDLVFTDLERCGYAVGAADLCAAGVGAPHGRQRLFFVAYANTPGRGELGLLGVRGDTDPSRRDDAHGRSEARCPCDGDFCTDADCDRRDGRVVDALDERREAGRRVDSRATAEPRRRRTGIVIPGAARDPWRECEWVLHRDNKWRPVEPGTFPLAHGTPARVGRLRGYGNAIVAQVAATFIEAALDAIGDMKR